ncbi:hypothetical protein PLESTB_000983200 [Pleodorina starrii]|uniref:Uncharacterized protein n=1 Tax=Pleodorina starrii TaxID=330485 RepID=A0A9W6BNR4_9CHLO|nr:hypothetical protein PLESTM_000545900 [Pleodorina starrii]GLC55398.1 hypothetical protein PLESTB_000983200 [Pleodorina starrii]GLC73794.1 hypothetical protein PLESTF_001421900 [Pleodorina starrii]
MRAFRTSIIGRKRWCLNQGSPCPLRHASQQPLLPRRALQLCGALIKPNSSTSTPAPPDPHTPPSSSQQLLDPNQGQQPPAQPQLPTKHAATGDRTPASSPSPSAGPSRSPTPGPGPGPGPNSQPPNTPNGDGGLSTRLRSWILLLAEYGGIYGTAAVLIAALTRVDAFGGLHWDFADVALGLGLMAPAMAFDAVVGLPDWATRQEDAAQVVRLFVDPDLLPQQQKKKKTEEKNEAEEDKPTPGSDHQQQQQQEEGQSKVHGAAAAAATSTAFVAADGAVVGATSTSATSSTSGREGDSSSTNSSTSSSSADGVSIFSSERTEGVITQAVTLPASAIAATSTSSSSSSGASPGLAATMRPATAAAAGDQSSPISSPISSSSGSTAGSSSETGAASGSGGGAPPPPPPGRLWAAAQRLRMALELMQESSIRNNPGARLTPLQEVAVILVAVTADEMLYRAVLLTLFGRWLRDRAYEAGAEEVLTLPGGLLGGQVDTAAAAQWVALGVGCSLGAAVFAARAWQETRVAERLRAMQEAQAEEAAKALRKQRLMGQHVTEEDLREEREKQARLQTAQASLVASIGVQGALVWLMEGGREVYQVAAAGSSFLLTGNLAAPLAGSMAVQLLVSAYQRLGLKRTMQRRARLVEARRKGKAAGEGEVAAATGLAAAAEAAQEQRAESLGAGREPQGAGGGGATMEETAAPSPAVPAAEQREQQQQEEGQQQERQQQQQERQQ